MRYVITTKGSPLAPQYTIDTRNWKFGPDTSADFAFDKPADAKKVELSELRHIDEIPNASNPGDAQ